MLVLTLSPPGVGWQSYIRWGVMSKDEMPLGTACLNEMVVSYPFLRTSDYNEVLTLRETAANSWGAQVTI